MADPVRRVLTHKKQRNLTNEQVHALLTDYADTETTYKALGSKFGISQNSISKIVNGSSYREVPGIAQLRKKVQQKAAARSARYSNAEPVRVPDATKVVFAVDPNSDEEIDAAILDLEAMRSVRNGPAAEIAA